MPIAPKVPISKSILPGAHQVNDLLPNLVNKRVGLLVNQASVINNTHLLDSLISLNVNITSIYTPEHGFRGKADAGEKIDNGIDQKTNLPIISLYGKHRKPTKDDLKNIDVMIFDLQDVGVRFYTYISTLHYVMEACAEIGIPVIILDRPNPNGFYVDGPVLDLDFKSFVGMHQVPIVYGLTIGEYGQMINGESWLKDDLKCDLLVVPCKNYNHKMSYDLPIKPSPNLPNLRSILLYPSLCLFEGSVVSIGRGTQKQFQIIGHHDTNASSHSFQFTPISQEGAKHPKLQDKKCFGEDLSTIPLSDLINNQTFDITKLVSWYKLLDKGAEFWRKDKFIDKLAGTDQLRLMIEHGATVDKIRTTWQSGLNEYKVMRKKYLLYEDFE